VARQLKKMGKDVRMIFSWDEFDRFRKVPKNFLGTPTAERLDYANFIGKPLVDTPSPYGGNESCAKYFENEFENALKQLQMDEIPVTMIYQAKEYKSGRYGTEIAFAIKKRKKIYDIISRFKTQGENDGERENYYPISIYCDYCGKDNTKILGYNEKNSEIEYECSCGCGGVTGGVGGVAGGVEGVAGGVGGGCGVAAGDGTPHKQKVDVKTASNIKLVWKVDWPMRWKAENICFEAAGIDHHSEGGSFDVATRISREIFGLEPPCSVCYAFVGIRGLNGMNGRVDMHSSSGLNITPSKLLQIYEPEILRWLYAKYPVGDAFDFGFDDTIIRYYQEFDRGLNSYLIGECDEYEKSIYDLALFGDMRTGGRINFGTLASVAPLTGFNKELTRKMLEKAGVSAFSHFDERFSRVQFWLENYMPDKIYKLLPARNNEFYNTLNDEQKATLAKLKKYLTAARTEKEIQEFLYSIINDKKLDKKQNQTRQQEYFKIFYNMLFGRNDGVRLYLFFATADKDQYLNLL
jgi:lysyl-tRNA synthetase class 1